VVDSGGVQQAVAFPAGDLFLPLLVGPKEPRFYARLLRTASDRLETTVASVAFGETFGLVRWPGGHPDEGFQIGIDAAVFAQLDLQTESFDLVNADYLVGASAAIRRRSFSARAKVSHQSSHLGDEFLLRTVPDRVNLSFEFIEVVAALDAGGWRAYWGGSYVLRRDPPSGRKLFADKGFHGASVREIVGKAEANLGAITYHFGAKGALYSAVVESIVAPMVERLVAAAGTTGSPLDRAEMVVRHHFEYLCAHPELPRLMIRSLLDTGQPPAAASRHLNRLIGALAALIQEGQQDGTIRDGVPLVMAIGLMSLSVHLTLMRGVMLGLGKIDLGLAADRSAVLDQIIRAVGGGLAAPPSKGAP
jgi:AcrR family transcriptional regulator